jgi:hypothetical protein
MSPQPAKSPAKCGVTRGDSWSALHPWAPYIERTVPGRMIARPDHLTIRPNPACRIGFAGLNPSCKLTTRPAQVICPSGGRALRVARAKRGTSLRAKRSNPCFLCGEMDCFASLAMTDGLKLDCHAFENCEVDVRAERSLTSHHKTHPSCPDLIRASIHLRRKFFEEDGSPGRAR